MTEKGFREASGQPGGPSDGRAWLLFAIAIVGLIVSLYYGGGLWFVVKLIVSGDNSLRIEAKEGDVLRQGVSGVVGFNVALIWTYGVTSALIFLMGMGLLSTLGAKRHGPIRVGCLLLGCLWIAIAYAGVLSAIRSYDWDWVYGERELRGLQTLSHFQLKLRSEPRLHLTAI